MRRSRHLFSVSIVSLAVALTPYPRVCDFYADSVFNGTDADMFVRCAETTYGCEFTTRDKAWFAINSTNEPVPTDCKKFKYDLSTSQNYSGPLAMPGLTELSRLSISGTYNGSRYSSTPIVVLPTRATTIELPDLVNISAIFLISYAGSISSLSVPKLRYIGSNLELGFTGGPAINLSFPSLFDVRGSIYLNGEIDALDFPTLNSSGLIKVNSTGNLDCIAFVASVVNATSHYSNNVSSCTSKKGSVTFQYMKPPEAAGAAFKIRSDFLAFTVLIAYMLGTWLH